MDSSLSLLRKHRKYHKERDHPETKPSTSTSNTTSIHKSSNNQSIAINNSTKPITNATPTATPAIVTSPPRLLPDPRIDNLPVNQFLKKMNQDVDRLDNLINNTTFALKQNRFKLTEARQLDRDLDVQLSQSNETYTTIESLKNQVQNVQHQLDNNASGKGALKLEIRTMQHELRDAQIENARLDEMKRRVEKMLQRKKSQQKFMAEVLKDV